MKSILLIGLGRFGRHMAQKFNELNQEVLAVDIDEERVNDILPFVTDAQIGDSTSEAFLSSLGVRKFDRCVVGLCGEFLRFLECSALLKDLGAPFVLARASRDVHAKFLLRNGANAIIYPEKDMAVRAAVKYSADNIFDYISLTPDYSIYETEVPVWWVGKTIVQLAVRTKYHINVLALKHGDNDMEPLPSPDHVFRGDERMLILGRNKDIERFLQL